MPKWMKQWWDRLCPPRLVGMHAGEGLPTGSHIRPRGPRRAGAIKYLSKMRSLPPGLARLSLLMSWARWTAPNRPRMTMATPRLLWSRGSRS